LTSGAPSENIDEQRGARWAKCPTRAEGRSASRKLPDDTLLWQLEDEFVSFDRRRIKAALGAAAGPLM